MVTLLDHTGSQRQGRAGNSGGKATLPRAAPVVVNGVTIPAADIARETQNHPAARPVDAWLAAARALVVRELLLQEARRLGIEAVPAEDEAGRRETDEEALIRALVEQCVTTPRAGVEECRRYYEQNMRRFRSADIFEVRHILFAADPADRSLRDAVRARAEAAIAALARSPAEFPALAAELSACPSARHGGSLGQISRGQTVEAFERALEGMREGELSQEPVETRYGFHVVLLDRRIEGVQLSFEAVQQRIASWLDEKVRRTALHQYIAVIAGAADIKGVSLDDSSSAQDR